MKLPRCNAFHPTATASRDRDLGSHSHRSQNDIQNQQQQQQQHYQEHDETTTATPRASGRTCYVNDSFRTNGSGMRRSHSTKGHDRTRPSSVLAGMRKHSMPMHKSRSHSQEQTSSCYHSQGNSTSTNYQARQVKTQEVAIPAYQPGHRGPSITVDKNDLTKMYDYATWNMYERIVSARRRRLSQEADAQQESQQQAGQRRASESTSESQVSSSSSQHGVYGTAATSSNAEDTNQKPLCKTSSLDESTLATADETDKSSTTSSSWSRTDSPGTYPGLTFQMGYERAVSSCPPPTVEKAGEDEHFIFQLDM